jgi:hypothetical protein
VQASTGRTCPRSRDYKNLGVLVLDDIAAALEVDIATLGSSSPSCRPITRTMERQGRATSRHPPPIWRT